MDSHLRNSKKYLSAVISIGKTTLLELRSCTKHIQTRRHTSSKPLTTCHSYPFQFRYPNFAFVRKKNISKLRPLVFAANCSEYHCDQILIFQIGSCLTKQTHGQIHSIILKWFLTHDRTQIKSKISNGVMEVQTAWAGGTAV